MCIAAVRRLPRPARAGFALELTYDVVMKLLWKDNSICVIIWMIHISLTLLRHM